MAKIKIDSNLYDRLKKVTEIAGYSSVEEFVVHMIEKELEQIEAPDDDKAVEERLRGLGYIE
jgi:metal-responsive CopG/Arc/MetJ family transcriptional regulator